MKNPIMKKAKIPLTDKMAVTPADMPPLDPTTGLPPQSMPAPPPPVKPSRRRTSNGYMRTVN